MSEIADAVQIIRVGFEGMDIAMKVGSATIGTMKKTMKFVFGMLNFEKSMGKTSMKKLLMRGGDLQVLEFNKSDLARFQKLAKKYGILYSVMPDIGREGKVEVLFHSEATPRMNLLISKLKSDAISVKSMDKFLEETSDKELGAFDKFLKNEKSGKLDVHADANLDSLIKKVGMYARDKKTISVDGIKNDLAIDNDMATQALNELNKIGVVDKPNEAGQYKVIMDSNSIDARLNRFQELTNRMRTIAASKDTNLVDITIAKKMVVAENDHAIKTLIPGTYKTGAKYIWLDKSDIMDIYNGKTILSYLDRNKDYKIYSKDNRVLETVRGVKLFEAHYDPVASGIREHFEKEMKPEVARGTQIRKR
jgi:hypothetical protein